MKTIQLSQGKEALVDDEVFDVLNAHKWCARKSHKTFYGIRFAPDPFGVWRRIHLHVCIWEQSRGPIPLGYTIDHRNRNGLDNQRFNLRLATAQEQNRNQGLKRTSTSGYIGVCWDKRKKKWQASAKFENARRFLGYFDDPIEAAIARDQFVLQHYGEFAETNVL